MMTYEELCRKGTEQLSAAGVTEAQLDEVAEKALNDGSIIYNPKEASLEDLKSILKKAW